MHVDSAMQLTTATAPLHYVIVQLQAACPYLSSSSPARSSTAVERFSVALWCRDRVPAAGQHQHQHQPNHNQYSPPRLSWVHHHNGHYLTFLRYLTLPLFSCKSLSLSVVCSDLLCSGTCVPALRLLNSASFLSRLRFDASSAPACLPFPQDSQGAFKSQHNFQPSPTTATFRSSLTAFSERE